MYDIIPYSTRGNSKDFALTILGARHTQIFPEAIQYDGLLGAMRISCSFKCGKKFSWRDDYRSASLRWEVIYLSENYVRVEWHYKKAEWEETDVWFHHDGIDLTVSFSVPHCLTMKMKVIHALHVFSFQMICCKIELPLRKYIVCMYAHLLFIHNLTDSTHEFLIFLFRYSHSGTFWLTAQGVPFGNNA